MNAEKAQKLRKVTKWNGYHRWKYSVIRQTENRNE